MFDTSAGKFYQSKSFILLIILIIIFFLYQIWQDYYQQGDLRKEIMRLEDQLSLISDEQTDLVDTLAYVQSDDFVEIEARTKLNLRKPGEQIIIVSSNDDIQSLVDGDSANSYFSDNNERSNFSKWWHHFWE